MQNFSNVCWSSSSWHIINLLTRKTIPKKGHKAPVTDRDGCIDGAEDGQVHPNPLEDAPSPDLEQAEQVATPEADVDWETDKTVTDLENSEWRNLVSHTASVV